MDTPTRPINSHSKLSVLNYHVDSSVKLTHTHKEHVSERERAYVQNVVLIIHAER